MYVTSMACDKSDQAKDRRRLMRRDDSSPSAYRADVVGKQRELLDAIRAEILALAPQIEEQMAYGMLNYPGIGCLAAQKHHVSLYVSPDVLDSFRDRFVGVNCGKSCVRFRKREQLDRDVLRRLLRAVLRTQAMG